LEELLLAFHHDRSVRSEADRYLKTAQRYLEWETDSTGIFGVGYKVKLLIPKGTLFGYYSGALTTASPHSNHCLAAGEFGGASVQILIDACTARNSTGDAGRLGLIQMLNHSCTPNCAIIPITLGPGLELFVARALVDIPVGTEPTSITTHVPRRQIRPTRDAFGAGRRPPAECPRAKCESSAFVQGKREDAPTNCGEMNAPLHR
jgi:hypothetical protein